MGRSNFEKTKDFFKMVLQIILIYGLWTQSLLACLISCDAFAQATVPQVEIHDEYDQNIDVASAFTQDLKDLKREAEVHFTKEYGEDFTNYAIANSNSFTDMYAHMVAPTIQEGNNLYQFTNHFKNDSVDVVGTEATLLGITAIMLVLSLFWSLFGLVKKGQKKKSCVPFKRNLPAVLTMLTAAGVHVCGDYFYQDSYRSLASSTQNLISSYVGDPMGMVRNSVNHVLEHPLDMVPEVVFEPIVQLKSIFNGARRIEESRPAYLLGSAVGYSAATLMTLGEIGHNWFRPETALANCETETKMNPAYVFNYLVTPAVRLALLSYLNTIYWGYFGHAFASKLPPGVKDLTLKMASDLAHLEMKGNGEMKGDIENPQLEDLTQLKSPQDMVNGLVPFQGKRIKALQERINAIDAYLAKVSEVTKNSRPQLLELWDRIHNSTLKEMSFNDFWQREKDWVLAFAGPYSTVAGNETSAAPLLSPNATVPNPSASFGPTSVPPPSSSPGDQVAPGKGRSALERTYLNNLALQYAPIIHLHPEDRYRPNNVEKYLQGVSMVENGKTIVPDGQVNLDSLAKAPEDASGNLRLKITETNPNEVRYGDLSSAVCYILPHYIEDRKFIEITYSFFYPFNGAPKATEGDHFKNTINAVIRNNGLGYHEGDWEHMTVRLTPAGQMVGVFYSIHSASEEGYHWYTQKSDDVDSPDGYKMSADGRLLGWSAFETHATYNRPGTFIRKTPIPQTADFALLDRYAKFIKIPDDRTSSEGPKLDCRQSNLILNYADPFGTHPWLKFKGAMGSAVPGKSLSETGPVLFSQQDWFREQDGFPETNLGN